jgi:hypothetical protein
LLITLWLQQEPVAKRRRKDDTLDDEVAGSDQPSADSDRAIKELRAENAFLSEQADTLWYVRWRSLFFIKKKKKKKKKKKEEKKIQPCTATDDGRDVRL